MNARNFNMISNNVTPNGTDGQTFGRHIRWHYLPMLRVKIACKMKSDISINQSK